MTSSSGVAAHQGIQAQPPPYASGEAPDEHSTAPAPGATAHKHRALMITLVVVAALVLAAAFAGYRTVQQGLAAKEAASIAIADAETAWENAQAAVEPDTRELTESQESRAAISAAKERYDAGFFVFAERYGEAEKTARAAEKTAQAISDRVAVLDDKAAAAGPKAAVGLYFKLYERYPRTPEGQQAIDNAADKLVGASYDSDCDCLTRLKAFCQDCPGDVPKTVYKEADARLLSASRDTSKRLKSMAKNNRSWARELNSKYETYLNIQGTAKADTAEISRMIAALSAVKGTEYKKVLVLLRDASKLGQQCSKIARSPVRETSKVTWFNGSQINRIASLSKQMEAKIAKANRLLKKI